MIAVDAMGGDFAPEEIIQGALLAARSGIAILLFGPESVVLGHLDGLDPSWRSHPITVVDAPEEIGMGEEPIAAVRSKTNSSLVQAVASCKEGKATAVVSAGNSGALMAAALFILGRQEGVERPPIAGFLPALQGAVLALDLGANADCKPHHLLQFAELGVAHAQSSLGVAKPRVGLLANGTEAGKGNALVREAHLLLAESGMDFVGNIEPDDVIANKVDIVVCDGFSGNILLKTMEATAELINKVVAAEVEKTADSSLVSTVGGLMDSIEKKLGMVEQGGAQLLGINGTVLVVHGNARADLLANAIKTANRIVGSA